MIEAWHDKFWSLVEKTDTCWNWTGTKVRGGYGRFGFGGKQYLPYRLSYEQVHGKIPAGLVVDHLCRNPSCVRPDHLEAVTHRENIKRGVRFWEKCPHGDEFRWKSNRTCRICYNVRRASRAQSGAAP